ncbi:hypothetical protein, partial [Roseateles sp.]|uniref:hypothetical protein n=1 Tax=Roseateles sp. TaxID=1971397 RepID=UPI003BA71D83
MKMVPDQIPHGACADAPGSKPEGRYRSQRIHAPRRTLDDLDKSEAIRVLVQPSPPLPRHPIFIQDHIQRH